MATTPIDPVELVRLVEEAVLEALEADSYTKVVDGETVFDRPALGKAVFAHVINARVEKGEVPADKAVTKGNLMKLVFPSTPESDPSDDEAEIALLVRKRLVGHIGSLIQTGRRGYVQKLVAGRNEGLVMCGTEVGDDAVPAVYVTGDPELIVRDWAVPRTSRLRSVAEEAAKELNFVIEHKPEMKKLLKAKMDDGLRQAQVAAKAVLAITAGDETAEH